jgi:hypothetical protein
MITERGKGKRKETNFKAVAIIWERNGYGTRNRGTLILEAGLADL